MQTLKTKNDKLAYIFNLISTVRWPLQHLTTFHSKPFIWWSSYCVNKYGDIFYHDSMRTSRKELALTVKNQTHWLLDKHIRDIKHAISQLKAEEN